MRVRSIHLNLGEERELRAVLALGEFLDLGLSAGLLRTKLVAREGENLKAAVF